MKTSALSLKSRLFGGGGTTSGVLGGIGSLHNVCHSLCVTVVSIAALFGITLNILPLMFLQTYQLYFWIAALIFTVTSLYFYLQQRRKVARDRNLLLINSGLLIFGLPLAQVSFLSVLADYTEFFRFIGLSLAGVGLILLIFGRKLESLVYSPEELEELPQKNPLASEIPPVSIIKLPKLTVSSVLFALIVTSFLVNQYYLYKMGIFSGMKMNQSSASTVNATAQSRPGMKMTVFDIALAKERMDKNNDGICDVCGMPIEQCISSGQMDCNMGNNPQTIGVLGTAHTHADFAVYINGEKLTLGKPENFMKSSFLHLDNNQNPEDANSVLHQHAKNVPFWLFFRSIGMKLEKDSLTTADGQILKNENGNTLKFYLNGKKVDELSDYSFQPLDKLLISYGPENDPGIQKQINSVTNFAKDRQK